MASLGLLRNCAKSIRKLRSGHLPIPYQGLKTKRCIAKNQDQPENSKSLIFLESCGISILQLLDSETLWLDIMLVCRSRCSCMMPRKQISAPRSLTLGGIFYPSCDRL